MITYEIVQDQENKSFNSIYELQMQMIEKLSKGTKLKQHT